MNSLSSPHLDALHRARLDEAGLDAAEVRDLFARALAEDLDGRGDITSAATIGPETELGYRYVARKPGVVAGLVTLPVLFAGHPDVAFEALVEDGARVAPGDAIATISGRVRTILELERTSLNLLTHLSGIASLTAQWVDAIAHTGAKVRDTRKTIPGLRHLAKYAVRCGGGVNHRTGLWDAILIKDNHIAAAGSVAAALEAAKAHAGAYGDVVVQVEVDGLDQLQEALDHGATQILIDNFSTELSRQAVALVRRFSATPGAPHVLVEASGGLTLDRAAEVAETGVDFLAVGGLTHSAPTLDIGLDAI